MDESILEVFERVDVPKELRKTGSIPGVLYGEGFERGVPVAFEEANLKKIIKQHGDNAKIMVDFHGNKKLGFIKELQRDSLTKRILHSDIQVASESHKVRMKLPIHYVGNNELEHRNLFLQVYNNHVDIAGEASIVPEFITVNVGGMKLHSSLKVKDLILDGRIKVLDSLDDVLATVTEMKGLNENSEEVEINETTLGL